MLKEDPAAPDLDYDYWAMIPLAQEMVPFRKPSADVPANQLIMCLDRAAKLVAGDIEDSVHRASGHSWAIFRYMFALWLYGDVTSNQLAAVTGMSRPQVSNMTGPLVKEGLVLRRKSDKDRRAVVISLTEQGESFISQTFDEHNQAEVEWAGGLTEIERDLLIALLGKLMKSPKGKQARENILNR